MQMKTQTFWSLPDFANELTPENKNRDYEIKKTDFARRALKKVPLCEVAEI